ncbi:MAG: DUF4180 domain-containing protein [Deinococcaceae bacterium]
MAIQMVIKSHPNYVELETSSGPVGPESTVLRMIELCFESGTQGVLIPSHLLSDDFFQLKTGVAGAMLQKLSQYRIRVAVVCSTLSEHNERFCEMVRESNRGNAFRVFETQQEAEAWLNH